MRKKTDEKPRQRTNQTDTVIRKAHLQEAELLGELGKRAFHEAFATQTAPEDMAAYLRTAFSLDDIKTQLNDKDTLYLIIDLQAEPVGYAYLYPTNPLRLSKILWPSN